MKFIEAAKLAASAAGMPTLELFLGMSGTADSLIPFLKAQGAIRGLDLNVTTGAFGTLSQTVLARGPSRGREAFLLFPWDFVSEFDWRTGLGGRVEDADSTLARARDFASAIAARGASALIFVDAPIAGLNENGASRATLAGVPKTLASEIGARIVGAENFSLGSYLASGCSVGGSSLSRIAELLAVDLLDVPRGQGKVLVTDFDNVLWSGAVADDGANGVDFAPEGRGFRHFLYQGFLKRLQGGGVLLAGVSRNDPDLAAAPLKRKDSLLRPDDFVAINAGYGPKSGALRALADGLGLGLDAFLFIDDNEVELAEVASGAPQVRRLAFPARDDALPEFFETIERFFAGPRGSAEDRDRTKLYRRRLETMPPPSSGKGDVRKFLAGLKMKLTIRERRPDDFARAVQLINKTNQFNANGRRIADNDMAAAIGRGARLYTATLDDRSGTHGEVLACVVDDAQAVSHFVMSCRVIERRVEFAFLAWLLGRSKGDFSVHFEATERNYPFRKFLEEIRATYPGPGEARIGRTEALSVAAPDLTLFEIFDSEA